MLPRGPPLPHPLWRGEEIRPKTLIPSPSTAPMVTGDVESSSANPSPVGQAEEREAG